MLFLVALVSLWAGGFVGVTVAALCRAAGLEPPPLDEPIGVPDATAHAE